MRGESKRDLIRGYRGYRVDAMSAALRAYERAREHGIGIGIRKAFDLDLGLIWHYHNIHITTTTPIITSLHITLHYISYKAPGITAQHRTGQTDRQTQGNKSSGFAILFHFISSRHLFPWGALFGWLAYCILHIIIIIFMNGGQAEWAAYLHSVWIFLDFYSFDYFLR